MGCANHCANPILGISSLEGYIAGMGKPRRTFPTDKPYPTFPLTPRADGRYAKKINGAGHVFGADGNWRAALDEYLQIARTLHSPEGLVAPTAKPKKSATAQQVVNRFLDARRREADAGIIKLGTWDDYRETLHHFLDVVGRSTPATELRGEHLDRFARHVTEKLELGTSRYHLYRANLRAFLRYIFDAGWLRVFPMGVHFKRIPKSKVRQQRKRRMLSPADLHALLDAAPRQLRAMILLGLNGGYGNTDCATLLKSTADLDAGLIDYRRQKTGIDRVIPLWPETVAALALVRDERPADDLYFRTKYGNAWVREAVNKKGSIITKDSIAQAFSDLGDSFCLWTSDPKGRKTFGDLRAGVGFYWMRHIHRTFSDEARDPHASMRVMGHAFPGMSDVYVEDVSIERLRAVVNHVRSRVFG